MNGTPVLVGFLITHPDGWQVLMKPDKARADLYAAKQHATIEGVYVMRAPVKAPEASRAP